MSVPRVSIIIPCYNEARNLPTLLTRLAATLPPSTYEVLIIDDHSTDETLNVLHSLELQFPHTVYRKSDNQRRGKATSLLLGFDKAQGEIIVMIDADLQYPPEAIPAMLKKIDDGADLVVAARINKHSSFLRHLTSVVFQKIFVRLLHGINVDAQSGLKAFKKEIITRIPLHPGATSFDVELLLKASQAGYRIDSVPVVFGARHGASRMHLLSTSFEIGSKALALKTHSPQAFPFLPEMASKEGYGFHFRGKKYIPHTQLQANETALYRFSRAQSVIILIVLLSFGLWLFINWHAAIVVIVAILTVLYFTDLFFNFYLIYRSFSRPPEINISTDELKSIAEADWPTYTIFCPLYKEPEVIPQFVTAMSALDYPKDKLQVMLLLEADDTTTIAKAKTLSLPSYFETIIVPHSLPKTKPKACNYGLLSARGEYCVIYDAEDVPDTDQLKKAVLAFRKAGMRIACIQAKLNFYNPYQNLLTRAFTAEYSLWFDLVLTGLQSINAPIPLGGTSNHFRTSQLRSLHGWDAFNVTEDCDLGIRLVKRGLSTAVLESTTLEEANSNLSNWFYQRSRWIKGYMQTYLVHMRRPQEFLLDWSEPHVLTFQLIVGGKILSMFINPLMWIITIFYFVFRSFVGPFIDSFFPAPVLYMGMCSFIFGNFLYTYYYMISCVKREQDELVKYALLVPFYWLAMSLAAWIAVKELILRPHHWAKTKHGLHLQTQKNIAVVQANLGRNLV